MSFYHVESLTADNIALLKGWFSFTTELVSKSNAILIFHLIRSALTTLTPSLVKNSLKQIEEKDIPKRLFPFFHSLWINHEQGPEEHLQ